LQPTWPAKVASTLNAAFAKKQGLEDQHINGGAPLFAPQSTGPLTAGMGKGPRGTEAVESNHVIAFSSKDYGNDAVNDLCPTLRAGGAYNANAGVPPAVAQASAVRRLTPTECERLQGFPDNYTQIPYRNKPAENCPDGPRYKAMGNSMAVPVMRWIGRRINFIDQIDDLKLERKNDL
jgi:DNA (cytosine-5)-methyltransferase 1